LFAGWAYKMKKTLSLYKYGCQVSVASFGGTIHHSMLIYDSAILGTLKRIKRADPVPEAPT